MALILNIDTAIDVATVSLSENGRLKSFLTNENQKDHAAWLQPAIKKLLEENKVDAFQLNAIGVNNGPGSYTGLRVGLSSAKGLCYAWKLPLIAVNSLLVLANAVKDEETDLICPMIDARRMEVFTAVYNKDLVEVEKPQSMVLNEYSFFNILMGQKILFLGNGSPKFELICKSPHAIFKKFAINPASLCALTYKKFVGNDFVDLAYVEPLYLKEFFTNS